MREERIFRGSAKGVRASALPDFGAGFLSIYTLSRRTTKSDVLTRADGHVSSGRSCLPSQESGVSAIPILGGSPVFMPTPFNAERPKSAWGWACFGEVSHAIAFARMRRAVCQR